MSVPKWCSRAKVFGEFSPGDQKKWFDLTEKKVIFNYDNLYYSVFLGEGSIVNKLLEDLGKLKNEFDFANDPPLFGSDGEFEYFPFGLKFYSHRLSVKDCFDILIADYLPNKNTPRVVVQIRAQYLWLEGFEKAFEESLRGVLKLLRPYEIIALRTQVNRLDYAFHTNCIQNFESYFDRKLLVDHCKTPARIYSQVGDPNQEWSIDYFSVGSRKSNSLFFRVYNKTREVVEQAYKCFFIKKWQDVGLINAYDAFCLENAYCKQSFDVGLLIARIDWYCKYGNDDSIKAQLEDLKKKYYADNDNSSKIKREIDKFLPRVTTVANVEYETHRTFYRSFANSIDNAVPVDNYDPLRTDIMRIYDCRKSFVDKLTSVSGFVSFVKFKGDPLAGYLDWWSALRRVNLDTDFRPEIYREYIRNVDIERNKRKIVSSMAALSVLKNGENTFSLDSDFSDLLGTINDNDMHRLDVENDRFRMVDGESGKAVKIKYGDHYTVKQRKNRQLRPVLSKKNPAQINNED